MTAIISLAFLHHAAAFLVVAAVTVELVLLRSELTPAAARSLIRIDALYGISAVLVLVAGFLRVFYTEKGSAYYFANAAFFWKIGLFAVAGILSIYPTMQFFRWRRALKQQQLPVIDTARLRKLRAIVHVELVCLLGMLLCAAMMARGVGMIR